MQIKKTLTSGKNKKNACSCLGSRYYNPRESVWLSVDPLAEMTGTPYAYCYQNPVILTDPNGRAPKSPVDDIFNAYGKFLYSTPVGNNVKVQIGKSLYNLSQLDYNGQGTRKAVSNIIAHYAEKNGYTGSFGVSDLGENDTVAHTTPWGTVFFNSYNLKKGLSDNYYDLQSALDHEVNLKFGHKGESADLRRNYTFLAHAEVYLGQAGTDNYKNSTRHNKYSVASDFVERLWNAYDKREINDDKLDSYIQTFNKSNTGNVTIINTQLWGSGQMSYQIKIDKTSSETITTQEMKDPHE